MGQALGLAEFRETSLRDEWEPVDESTSVIRGEVIAFLNEAAFYERNGIHKRSLGDRTDYIAAVETQMYLCIDTDRGVQRQ